MTPRPILKKLLRHALPEMTIYLYGSRARGDAGKASDFDIWIDGDVSTDTFAKIHEQLEDSFVPFSVNFVTTNDLKGEFAKQVKKDAIQWS